MPDQHFRTRPAKVRDRYAQAVTDAVRTVSAVAELPQKGTPEFDVLAAFAGDLRPLAILPEPVRWPAGTTVGTVLDTLRADCARSLAEHGVARPGKHNAPVGKAALTAAFPGDELIATVRALADRTELRPVSASYIVYDGPGSQLELHVDKPSFGDLNLLVRLDDPPEQPVGEPSATVFVTAEGVQRMPLGAGEGILFDGTGLLHGRTPLRDGEAVTLLSIGLRTEAP